MRWRSETRDRHLKFKGPCICRHGNLTYLLLVLVLLQLPIRGTLRVPENPAKMGLVSDLISQLVKPPC